MKILYHHRIKSRDGQYIHIRSMVDAFRRAGHEVDEVGLTAGESFHLGEESRFWKAFMGRMPTPLLEMLEYGYSLPGALWLYSKILRDRPDFIYERYAQGNFAGVLAARWTRLPLFLEVNSPLARERHASGHIRYGSLARRSERLILKWATKILVVSERLKEIYVEEGIDSEKFEVIHNGIDPQRFENRDGRLAREAYNLRNSIVIGFVGFLRKWHRVDLLLSLLARELSGLDVKVMLVGDGPARPELERMVRNLDLEDRVIWTGTINHDQIPDMLAAMDITLLSDMTEYSSPLKLFEYMAAGKAIVAPHRPSVLEVLRDGETGLLFEPCNLTAMGDALRRLAVDPDLRARLGSAARRDLIAKRFTWDENAGKVLKLLEKV